MRLSDIKSEPLPHHRRKRVGRGRASGTGGTAGRGNKGSNSRAGAGGRAYYEGGQTPLFRRMPKRGFSNADFQQPHDVVNVEELNRFPAGSEVGLDALREAGLIRRRSDAVKILGRGRLNVALTVMAHAFSEKAAVKIKAAGGEAKTL